MCCVLTYLSCHELHVRVLYLLQLFFAEYGWQRDVSLLVVAVDVVLADDVLVALPAQSGVMKMERGGRQRRLGGGGSRGRGSGSQNSAR